MGVGGCVVCVVWVPWMDGKDGGFDRRHPFVFPPNQPINHPLLLLLPPTANQVRERHADELLMVARGVYQLRARLGVEILGNASSFDELHAQLDELHLKRIALRILIGHYLALHLDKRPDYVGLVCLKTRLRDVVEVRACVRACLPG
jgi:hypothetical protein